MLAKLSKNAKITISILFIFIGLVLISYNYFEGIKHNVFNYQNIRLLEQQVIIDELPEEVSVEDFENTVVDIDDMYHTDGKDNYIGYLEVPEVNIKRGFVSLDSKYNSVGYNVMLIKESQMPDEKNGNLILAAHRGNSPVSFFEKLYTISDSAIAKVTYKNRVYTYRLKNRYYENKDGNLTIKRNADANILTLITCTKNDKKTQTVFIFELESVE